MECSNMFMRGQVWYWEDPVYGKKEYGIQVPIGECGMRYNRYCVIVQNTKRIGSGPILVIPCSSHSDKHHDVKIQIATHTTDHYTYAKPNMVFPVHGKMLTRYICTLSDEAMKRIEAELIKFMIPSVTDAMSYDDIKKTFGINMTRGNDYIDISRGRNTSMLIQKFMDSDLDFTGNKEDVLTPTQMKDAFDRFCINRNVPILDDIIQFIDTFMYHRTKDTRLYSNGNPDYNSLEFTGVKLMYDPNEEKKVVPVVNIAVPEKKTVIASTMSVNAPAKKPHAKWTEETKITFLEIYATKGVTEAAQQFQITISTAKYYRSVWKDLIPEKMEVKSGSTIPSTKDIGESISMVSALMMNHLARENVYKGLDHIKLANGNDVDETEFYNKCKSAIYFSLMDLIDVHQNDDNSIRIPKVTKDCKYLKTWHFLDKVFHDRSINQTDGKYMMESYRKHYGSYNQGIHIDWIHRFIGKMNRRFRIAEYDLAFISEILMNTYCDLGTK